jgi:capsular polysaccharide biosynthesis protein
MTERDYTIRHPVNGAPDGPAELAAFTDFPMSEDRPADVTTGLVSLGFIWGAIKRSVRLLCALAIVGCLLGIGFFVAKPPAYKAQTSVLITYGIGQNPSLEVLDDQAIAQSHTVARLAMDKLGIHESLGSFAASYTVNVITERVVQITASAPTGSEAVSRAGAVASEFLQFMAQQEETTQNVVVQTMQQELTQDLGIEASLNTQISTVKAKQKTPAQQAKLTTLQGQANQAAQTVSSLQGTLAETETGSQTLPAVKGTVILDPATAEPYSKTKDLVTYAVYGIVGGVALGLGIVVIGALISDKLRRRDDIARALGAPVGLSVGPIKLSRKLPPSRRGLKAVADPDIKRVADHLRAATSTKERPVKLAVVPADDPAVAALALVALAISLAEQGRKVMLVDLARGVPAADLLGRKSPGVGKVRAQEASLMLAVPNADEIAPKAPADLGSPTARRSAFGDEIAAAYASVDVLLTLCTLDPARGADHLATWANRAVVVVTGGRSSWTKLQATSEMLRVAGLSLSSTVLVGADESDESLGSLGPGPDALFGVGR